jgi:hypothetical protein
MKATLQKLVGMAALGLTLVSNSTPAWAGAATRNEVYISPSRTSAQGSLTGARYSADGGQYIGCDTYFDRRPNAGPPASAYCFAGDKIGRHTNCFSTDPRFVDAVKGMTDSSHLYFRMSSTVTRVCTDLEISNESLYLK